MTKYPLLVFPQPERMDRSKRGFPPKDIHYPTYERQNERLTPLFSNLQNSFERRKIEIQSEFEGLDPEQVIVFETVGSVDDFVKSVKKVEGLEWMGEIEIEDIAADDDFYEIEKEAKALSGRLFLTMSNQRALNEMLSLWETYKENPQIKFRKGLASFKRVFSQLKDVRKWGVRDRFIETNIIRYWEQKLNYNFDIIRFELQLWFSSSESKRTQTQQRIQLLIESLQGRIISFCVIPEISYHALLVELSSQQIKNIIESRETKLVKCDDIMFFRPSGQAVVDNEDLQVEESLSEDLIQDNQPTGEPVVALLDGMPLENHNLLKNRLIVDDPDNFGALYDVEYRKHGTSMSSLIIHGDLNENAAPISYYLYVRPIMKLRSVGNNREESVPDDILYVDLIHRAVKRICEGDNEIEPIKSIKVINLSICDRSSMFYQTISPEAKLLDWLSYKYNILFIISVGNHIHELTLDDLYRDFKTKSEDEKEKDIYLKVVGDQRNRRILSPSESMNNLSIGSVHFDHTGIPPYNRNLNPTVRTLPNVHSAFGGGYRRSIKPDFVYYGGKQLFWEVMLENQPTPLRCLLNAGLPGQKVAAPSSSLNDVYHSRGTSNATALISNNSIKIYDILLNIFGTDTSSSIMKPYIPLFIKTLLVHGCSWGDMGENLRNILNTKYPSTDVKKIITKWMGYGLPDIEKVTFCTSQRVTVLGYGKLRTDDVHLFKFPLPPSLSSIRGQKKLTISLGWFTPIASKTQKYRVASLLFEAENEKLSVKRENLDWNTVKKGTLQHEVFVGEEATPFEDGSNIGIKVICKKDAGDIIEAIPYTIAVTVEVAESLNLPIYEEVKERIVIRVPIEQKV